MSQEEPPSIEDWIVSVVRARLDAASEEEIKDIVREVLVEEAVVGYGGELGLHTIESEEETQSETEATQE